MLDDAEFAARARRISLLCLDVDGTMTDGGIIVHDDGSETKVFSVRDGFAIKAWQMFGHKAAIITGRTCHAVDRRAEALGFDVVVQNVPDKSPAFRKLLGDLQLSTDEVCYVGDDLPDVPLLKAAGLGIAVGDAVAEARDAADGITNAVGGRGAVREVIERLLVAQGRWQDVVALYQHSALES